MSSNGCIITHHAFPLLGDAKLVDQLLFQVQRPHLRQRTYDEHREILYGSYYD